MLRLLETKADGVEMRKKRYFGVTYRSYPFDFKGDKKGWKILDNAAIFPIHKSVSSSIIKRNNFQIRKIKEKFFQGSILYSVGINF